MSNAIDTRSTDPNTGEVNPASSNPSHPSSFAIAASISADIESYDSPVKLAILESVCLELNTGVFQISVYIIHIKALQDDSHQLKA